MIARIVKCDRCSKFQEQGAPLAEGERLIRKATLLGRVTKHLCGTCQDEERRILSASSMVGVPEAVWEFGDSFEGLDED